MSQIFHAQAELVALQRLMLDAPPRHRSSFSNHVRTTLAPNPNLMHSASLHVHPGADAVRRLFPIRLVRIPQCHLAVDNQMRCQPAVRVGRVVRVSAAAH